MYATNDGMDPDGGRRPKGPDRAGRGIKINPAWIFGCSSSSMYMTYLTERNFDTIFLLLSCESQQLLGTALKSNIASPQSKIPDYQARGSLLDTYASARKPVKL